MTTPRILRIDDHGTRITDIADERWLMLDDDDDDGGDDDAEDSRYDDWVLCG